jgi:hypothetical protein
MDKVQRQAQVEERVKTNGCAGEIFFWQNNQTFFGAFPFWEIV